MVENSALTSKEDLKLTWKLNRGKSTEKRLTRFDVESHWKQFLLKDKISFSKLLSFSRSLIKIWSENFWAFSILKNFQSFWSFKKFTSLPKNYISLVQIKFAITSIQFSSFFFSIAYQVVFAFLEASQLKFF